MTLEQRYAALLSVPEFQDLPADALATLAAGMREEHYQGGETVIVAGELADRVFVLCGGMLDVTQPGRDGVLRRLGPGTLLGELAFFAETPRTATVQAAVPSILLSLGFENFRAFLLRHPTSLLILTGRIVRTLRELEMAGVNRL